MRQPAYVTALAFLMLVAPGHAQEDHGSLPDRPASFVAATRAFAFYSDPVLNLHDFLMHRTRAEEQQEQADTAAQCLERLPPADRDAFERAQSHYGQTMAGKRWNDDLMLALRWELAGFSDVEFIPDSAIAPTLTHLHAAAPAYRSCWWPEHDARNRARIAQLVPRLNAHEDTLLARLAVLFGEAYRPPFPVDIVGWTSSSGANTVINPDHIVMSSTDPGYDDDSGLEMVFHEASHTVLGPGNGAVWRALDEAAAALDVDQLPGTVWHPILFYTTGKVVQALLSERGVTDYELYVYREGLFDRAWPELRQPLEQHWQPYLDGRVELEESTRRLLEAVRDVSPSLVAVTEAQEGADANPRVVWIGLANGSEAEAVMATELRALMRRHNLEPWILTRRVLINENQISHSHPILTISTGHLGKELELLSTFVHEQLHWLEEEPWRDDFWAAMRDFEALFPDVPSSADGGARDDRSTYRHLLVCDMEYQALTALVGEVAARKTLAGITHYEWIYEKVLNDPRVREVAVRHGFDVSDGVPRQ